MIVRLKEGIEIDAQREKQRAQAQSRRIATRAGSGKRMEARRTKAAERRIDKIARDIPAAANSSRCVSGPADRNDACILYWSCCSRVSSRCGIGIRLPGERGRYAILIAAQHVGQRGPTAGDLPVLRAATVRWREPAPETRPELVLRVSANAGIGVQARKRAVPRSREKLFRTVA